MCNGSTFRLAEEVDSAAQRIAGYHSMGSLRLNDDEVGSRDEPFIAARQVHESKTPLEYVEHPPVAGRKRVFPLKSFRHRAVRKVEGTTAGYKSCRYSGDHQFNSYVVWKSARSDRGVP